MKKTTTRRRPKGVPQLLTHRVRGARYGYALFDGVRHSYGKLDDEARRLFAEDLATWKANGCVWPAEPEPAAATVGPVTVRDLVERYRAALKAERSPSWFEHNEPRIRLATDAVVELDGDTLAADYGPKRLKVLQEHLCSVTRADDRTPKFTRKTINERVRIVVTAFAWGVADELLPAEVLHGLRAVAPLHGGKPGTRESRKVDPVAREVVEATLPYLNKPVAALVELLWWTGARPGELFGLRPCDIDRSTTPWKVELREHKTAWKGKARVIHFGAEARKVLEPFLLRPATRPLFRPAEGMADSNRMRGELRERKRYDGDVARYAREKAERGRQEFCEVYDAPALRKAILRAVKRCNDARANEQDAAKRLPPLPSWFTYQLRHSAATRLRKEHGIEAARVLLGHTSAGMTEVYAEADLARAAMVAEVAG